VPGALTMVARAGTPLSEIKSVLAAEGQQLAFEPTDYKSVLNRSGTSTIGGVFATNSSGARRIQCGGARDFLLGVRFVDGQGMLIKNGGRVMKNVTGYDLVKLMAGSWGTLGVMSEVSFKVLPAPEKTASLLLETLNHKVAVAAMAAALGSPYDVSGAAYLPGSGACLKNLWPIVSTGCKAGSKSLAKLNCCMIKRPNRAGKICDVFRRFAMFLATFGGSQLNQVMDHRFMKRQLLQRASMIGRAD
ncbi:MAG: FAD-binding protein, partial [Paracoccaceae bacterium]